MKWHTLIANEGEASHLKVGGWLLLLLYIGLAIYGAIVHRDLTDYLDRIGWMIAGLWAFRVVNYVADKIKNNAPNTNSSSK